MKRDPFQDYSKPPAIDYATMNDIIYDAVCFLYATERNCRNGDIFEYLIQNHDNIEFNQVTIARHLFDMEKSRIGWTCKKIDGNLYPVCYPISMSEQEKSLAI